MTESASTEQKCGPIKMHRVGAKIDCEGSIRINSKLILKKMFFSNQHMGFSFLSSPSLSIPASVFGQSHGVLLVQVEVSGKLPQVRFALGRLVDLKEQVDGVLPVSV